jgi:hypothetical protein
MAACCVDHKAGRAKSFPCAKVMLVSLRDLDPAADIHERFSGAGNVLPVIHNRN